MAEQIRVALIGGSITGLTMAHGLLGQPHITFDVFEKRSSFVHGGTGISLSKNADKALQALGLPHVEMYKAGGAVQAQKVDVFAGFGKHKGKSLADLSENQRHWIDRSRWLEQLLKGLPEERLHPGRTLTRIEQRQDVAGYVLEFEDGIIFEADAVIGCDGVHSPIRHYILHPDHDGLIEPVFAGLWDAHGEIESAGAVRRFGQELFNLQTPSAMAIAGEGACIMFNPYDDGTKYRVIMSGVAGPTFDGSKWKQKLSREFLEDSYRDWDKDFRDGVVDLILADTYRSGVAFSEFEHPNTPTYSRDAVCVIGDAAHAVIPWMAQGACLATEDAAVLSAVLCAARSRGDLPAAMIAFDLIRRPRVESVRALCREVSKVLTGQYGLDPDKIAELDPKEWYNRVGEIDMDSHVQEAVELFKTLRKH